MRTFNGTPLNAGAETLNQTLLQLQGLCQSTIGPLPAVKANDAISEPDRSERLRIDTLETRPVGLGGRENLQPPSFRCPLLPILEASQNMSYA